MGRLLSERGAKGALLRLGSAARFALVACVLAPVAPLAVADPLDEQVAALAQPVIDSGAAVGLVVGWINADGRGVAGFGRARDDRDDVPDGDTLFEIGSVTKVFTSLLLADMAEQGLVALDQPVRELLPDKAGLLERDGRPIRLVDLATHTSGLLRIPNNMKPADVKNPYADYTVKAMYEYLADRGPRRTPGERFAYSNLGMGLLGHALALRAGKDFESLIIERIAAPLAMHSTRITLSEEDQPRLATGHDADGDAYPNWDLPTLAGAGALRSTADDMLNFLAAQLGICETPLSAAIAATHESRHDANPETLGKIALGWFVQGGDSPVLWHNGQTGGYHSFVGFRPEPAAGVVVLTNTGTGVIDALGFKCLDLLAGKEVEPLVLTIPIELDAETLDRYIGRYQLASSFVLDVTREDNQLFVQATGQDRFRVYAKSETEFFYRIVDAQITFHADDDGNVNELVLHQNGREMSAERIENGTPAAN